MKCELCFGIVLRIEVKRNDSEPTKQNCGIGPELRHETRRVGLEPVRPATPETVKVTREIDVNCLARSTIDGKNDAHRVLGLRSVAQGGDRIRELVAAREPMLGLDFDGRVPRPEFNLPVIAGAASLAR